MTYLFLILFCLAEIALVVLTFTKWREKAAWLQNRAVIRLAETVLLTGIVLLPATNLKWRFFTAVAVLVIRLLIAGIVWLVRRRKATGIRKKGFTIVSCVLSIILTAFSLTPAFLFSNYNGLPTTGSYTVRETGAILVDESREDTFENDGSFREVPAHFFYPDTEDGDFPLVVFSHGAFGYYQSNYSTYQELASNGYVVAALDHPHHAFFTKDTDGSFVTVDNDFINDAMQVGGGTEISDEEIFNLTKSWMQLRVDDGNFVLDSVKTAKASQTLSDAWHAEDAALLLDILKKTDTDKIGCIGHSLGGAAGVALGRERSDIGAVIDLDGTALGEVTAVRDGKGVCNDTPFPVPLLVISRETEYNEREQPGVYAGVNENLVDHAETGKLVTFRGAGHMDFTDLPILSPFLGSLLGHGEVDSEACMTQINSLVLNWFDYYLKNEGTLAIQAQY